MELPSGEDLGFVRPKAYANSGNFLKKVHYESKLDVKANTYLAWEKKSPKITNSMKLTPQTYKNIYIFLLIKFMARLSNTFFLTFLAAESSFGSSC